MSNEQALMIVETTQPSQIAVQGVVNSDEVEYQRTSRQCNVIIAQLRGVAKRYTAAMERLIQTWLAENYPDLHYTTTPIAEDGVALKFGVILDIDASIGQARGTAIQRELTAYLARLER